MYPLNPDIMFQEDRDRRAALMSARRGDSWFSRVRARLTRRRLEEVLVIEAPATEVPAAEAPDAEAPAPVLPVVETGHGPDVTPTPAPEPVEVPAQRLPGQLGPPAQGPVQPAVLPATAAQNGVPAAAPEPAQAPTPPVAPSP